MKKRIEDISSPSVAFDMLFKFLSCAALLAVAAPIIHSLTCPIIGGWAVFLALVLSPLLFGTGYALQALYGRVAGIKRTASSRSYEKLEKYFKLPDAALTITLGAGAGMAVTGFISRYMRAQFEAGIDRAYDKSSLIPFLAGLFCSVFIIAGIAAWFYPRGYIINLRSLIPCLVVIIADFMINITFGVGQEFLVACTAVFMLLSAIVMNQNHIVDVINASGTGDITPRVRFYNLLAVGIFCLFVVVTMPIALSVIVGLMVLGRMFLLFVLRNSIVGEENDFVDANEQASQFESNVFGKFSDFGSESQAKFYFIIFMLLLLTVIFFFIIIRRRNVFRIIFDFINKVFSNILEFLTNLFSFNKFSTEKFALSNYRDTEEKVDKKAIREYSKADQPARSYGEFRRRLDMLTDAGERLKFAYKELIRCWGEIYIRLNISDTPAEIKRKIEEAASGTDAELITRAFEAVKYAEHDLPPAESHRLVEIMCAQIKARM